MRAFYERWLWIMKIFFVEESRLSPRAVMRSDGQRRACIFCRACAQVHRFQGCVSVHESNRSCHGTPNWPTRVAVKVTDCPEFEGFTDETSVVVVLAWFTTW